MAMELCRLFDGSQWDIDAAVRQVCDAVERCVCLGSVLMGTDEEELFLEAPTLPFGHRFWEWQRHIAFCRNVVFCVISVGSIDLHPHSKTCHADLTVFKGNSMAIPSHPPFFSRATHEFQCGRAVGCAAKLTCCARRDGVLPDSMVPSKQSQMP